MLEAIRQRFTGWIAFLVIGLIAVTLVISFGNMDQTPIEDDVVITVNGNEITLFEYREEYSNKIAEFQEMLGDQIPDILELTIKESTTEDLILRSLLLDYMNTSGYRVSPEYVVELIRSNEGLQIGGEFDFENYRAILASQGITMEKFESDLRLQLEINQLRRGFIETSFITPSEFRHFIELQLQKRSGELITIKAESFSDQVTIEDSQASRYYENNLDLFQTNEEIDVEYLTISLDDVAQNIDYTEDDLRNYYEDNLERFVSNEERKSSHILVAIDDDTSEEEALSLILEVKSRLKTENFEDIAKELSDDPGSAELGGDLGWAEPGLFVPEFDKALFNLEKGEMSEPVQTQFGFHLIRLDDLKVGQQQEFDEIIQELDIEYSRLLAEDELFEKAERLADLSLQAFNELSSVAAKLDLSLNRLDGITRNGNSIFNQDPELINNLFSQNSIEASENTPLFELGESIIVARVISHRLPEIKDFLSVQIEINNYLIDQQSLKLASDFAESLKQQIDSNDSFKDLAEEFNLEASTFDLTRGDTELSSGLVEAIFSSSTPNLDVSNTLSYIEEDKVFLFKIGGYEAGKLEVFSDEERNSAKLQLSEQIGSRELNAFAEYLRDNAEIYIEPNLYDDLYDF